MINAQGSSATFEAVVTGRFGILPNFFRSAQTAPELLEHLWGFAKAGYLDNPMPSIFKERLFVWLSRYCPMRYCIVRHVGFLLGKGHGFPAGDAAAGAQTIDQVINLLRRPSPWKRDMALVYASLVSAPAALEHWPEAGSRMEEEIFRAQPCCSLSPREATVPGGPSFTPWGFEIMNCSADASPLSALRITGRCFILRSNPKKICWNCSVATRNFPNCCWRIQRRIDLK